VRNVSQWPNLSHLGEPLGGAEGLLEAVSFNNGNLGGTGGTVPQIIRWGTDMLLSPPQYLESVTANRHIFCLCVFSRVAFVYCLSVCVQVKKFGTDFDEMFTEGQQ